MFFGPQRINLPLDFCPISQNFGVTTFWTFERFQYKYDLVTLQFIRSHQGSCLPNIFHWIATKKLGPAITFTMHKHNLSVKKVVKKVPKLPKQNWSLSSKSTHLLKREQDASRKPFQAIQRSIASKEDRHLMFLKGRHMFCHSFIILRAHKLYSCCDHDSYVQTFGACRFKMAGNWKWASAFIFEGQITSQNIVHDICNFNITRFFLSFFLWFSWLLVITSCCSK